MATYFHTQNGRIKIQAETLLGTDPGNGWIYQPPGTGNAGAQGGHYYFRDQALDGSVKTANQGVFSATIYVAEAGLYTIRMRSARDTNDPGDSRNDIWMRVDDDIRPLLPEGTVPVSTTASGFVKLKGASTAWGYARVLSASQEEDANPPATVLLSQGFHTITFAGRSVGFHIDFFEVIRQGLSVAATAPDTAIVDDGPALPDSASVAEDGSIVLDLLAGTSGLTLVSASDPANGTTLVTPDRLLRYTPDADFFGTDSFSFSVRDAFGVVTTRTLTMTVAATPDDPFAADDAADTFAGTPVSVAVLGNDGDPDGTAVAVGGFDATSAGGGSVALVAGQLRYTPGAGFTGTDSFSYDVVDPTGRVSNRATVTVTVDEAPASDLPIRVGLYDTATDGLIDLLADGDVLDAAALAGATTFAVGVVAGGALDGRVGSMKLRLSGDATAAKTETGAPYALFGDDAGDLLGGRPIGPGSYRFEVDVFAQAGGKGALLDSFDFDFSVAAPPPAAAPIRVGLYNTATDGLIDTLADGALLDAADLAGATTFAVEVVAGGALDGRVGSMKLRLSGDATAAKTETGAPYALFGDDAGDLLGGRPIAAGSYRFEVDVYAQAGGKGALLDSFDYDFTVAAGLLLV
jgi:hypothetical protein